MDLGLGILEDNGFGQDRLDKDDSLCVKIEKFLL